MIYLLDRVDGNRHSHYTWFIMPPKTHHNVLGVEETPSSDTEHQSNENCSSAQGLCSKRSLSLFQMKMVRCKSCCWSGWICLHQPSRALIHHSARELQRLIVLDHSEASSTAALEAYSTSVVHVFIILSKASSPTSSCRCECPSGRVD